MRRKREVRITAWERLVAGYATDEAWAKLGMSPKTRRRQTVFKFMAVMALIALIIMVFLGMSQQLFERSHWVLAVGLAAIVFGILWEMPRTSRHHSHKWRLLVRDRERVSWLDEPWGGDALKHRRASWIERLESGSPKWHRHPMYFFWMVLSIAAIMGWNALRAFGVTPNGAEIIVPLLLWGSIGGLFVYAKLGSRRHLTRLKGDLCIDCGYSLGELPAERLVTRDGGSVSVGPERCPECGCPWPMVPPRALEDWVR